VTRKFEVQFLSQTGLAPSFVYVSPSPAYPGYFAAGILYVSSKSGNFQSPTGIARTFSLEQNLLKTQAEAIQGATDWLSDESRGGVTLNEVNEVND
jgi:hypothetical protein